MESERAWLKFIKSGSIKSYLDYCRVKNIESSQEIWNATENDDRRDSYQRNEHRGIR